MSTFPLPFLIYGANGYTGKLIAREAVRRGMRPILAGRNAAALRELGTDLDLEVRVFDCNSASEISENLGGLQAVLHCAGPFSSTSKAMVEACLQMHVHYLDISGEIPVFERILSQPKLFKEAGIVAIPGVGFDIVPTDCLAALLHEALPDAQTLILALKVAGGPSPGTFKTLTSGMPSGGMIRKKGELVKVPAVARSRMVSFSDGLTRTYQMPWADVSSAWYSTGIPNIEVYLNLEPKAAWAIRASNFINPLFKLKPIQALMNRSISASVAGPSEARRGRHRYEVWGEVRNVNGDTKQMHIRMPNGYDVTVDTALKALSKVLDGSVKPGAYTPSLAFTSGFLHELEGMEILSTS